MFWKRKAKTDAKTEIAESPHAALLEKFNALCVPYGNGKYYRRATYKGSSAEAGYIELDPEHRPDFLIYYVKNPPLGPDREYRNDWNVTETFGKLLRRKADFTPSQIVSLFHNIKHQEKISTYSWPLGLVVNQLEKTLKKKDLTESEHAALSEVAEWKLWTFLSYGHDLQKVQVKLAKLLGEKGDIPKFHLGNVQLAYKMKITLKAQSEAKQEQWNRLFNTAASANGSKPTKKLQAALKAEIESLGKNEFRTAFQDWANWAAKTPNAFHDRKGRDNHYYGFGQLNGKIQTMLKGLVWGMAQFHDEKSLAAIAALAEKSFERIKGPSLPPETSRETE